MTVPIPLRFGPTLFVHPLEVLLAAVDDGHDDELRHVVRVPLAQHVPERIDLFGRRLDEQLLLLIDLRHALPGVDRTDTGQDVDAGRQTAADEILRQRRGVEVAGEGGQGQDEVAHVPIFLLYSGRKTGTSMSRMTLEDMGGAAPRRRSCRRRGAGSDDAGAPRPASKRITLGLSLALCVLLVNSLVGENGYLATLRIRQEKADLEATVAALRRQNQQLQRAGRLDDDPAALEEEARRCWE